MFRSISLPSSEYLHELAAIFINILLPIFDFRLNKIESNGYIY